MSMRSEEVLCIARQDSNCSCTRMLLGVTLWSLVRRTQ
jgi:hypothetical protein